MMDVAKLVFIDETWATTNLTRSYGRAPRGVRCIGSAPLGDWQTTTFVAGLRHQRLTAPMVVDGPMDGELFLAWVEQFLCPNSRVETSSSSTTSAVTKWKASKRPSPRSAPPCFIFHPIRPI
jgi:hypothetical protein